MLLAGRAEVRAGDLDLGDIGTRGSVFDPVAPDAVYVPAGSSFQVRARGPLELALCSAPGTDRLPPRLIAGRDLIGETRGSGTDLRHVVDILPESQPARSLLVVEVRTPAGHWSSYPPHRHDRIDLPRESMLEETYYHRIDPPQGFAVQRVYTDDRSLDETMTVEDGDTVMVPRGYHLVGAAHGYDLYYLNVMAGPMRRWQYRDDPDHAWLQTPE